MSEFTIQSLLGTPIVSVRDIQCRGTCRARGAEEHTASSHLVFPYRGVYVRHVGRDEVVAEANQVLLFSPDEDYRVSHPVAGGDACLSLVVDDAALGELVPRTLLRPGPALGFERRRLPIEPRIQAIAAQLRRDLHDDRTSPLEAESRGLALIRRALGGRAARSSGAGAGAGRQRLVDRAKLVVTSDLSRRWTLAEIAAEVGASPVYLTQLFQQIEGIPLYRYQLRLRLARALDLLDRARDLTVLALELGFSSHSHFTAVFRQTYGVSPSVVRGRLVAH